MAVVLFALALLVAGWSGLGLTLLLWGRTPRRLPGPGELLCVSLHGDYRYDELKNTPDELREQEHELPLLRRDLHAEHGSESRRLVAQSTHQVRLA